MSSFDRNRLLKNIPYLAKEKNIKIGDLEAAAKVSPGYFSRLNKGDSNAIPNVEVLTAVSEKLSVTLDSLVKVNYEGLTATERYLIDFIDRLISKTSALEMQWDVDTVGKMLASGIDEYGYAVHPLFEMKEVTLDPDLYGGRHITENRPVFNSLFHDYEEDRVNLFGPAYHVEFDHDSVLWLVSVLGEGRDGSQDEEIEFYMEQYGKVKPICHTNADTPNPFNVILVDLYNAATETSKRPKIDQNVRAAIDSFMQDLPLPF